jgi:hypothetical protein
MTAILTGIISFLAGFVSGYVIKIRIDSRKHNTDSSTRVEQKDVFAGGHVAGRDVNTRDPGRKK